MTNPYHESFWKTLLERIQKGDAPFGTRIQDHFLIYKKQRLDLRTADLEAVIDFYQTQIGLQLEFIQFPSWKEIKRKVIRDNLIFDYVKRMQQAYQLSTVDTGRLLSTIHLYITLKKITPQEIHLMTYRTCTSPA